MVLYSVASVEPVEPLRFQDVFCLVFWMFTWSNRLIHSSIFIKWNFCGGSTWNCDPSCCYLPIMFVDTLSTISHPNVMLVHVRKFSTFCAESNEFAAFFQQENPQSNPVPSKCRILTPCCVRNDWNGFWQYASRTLYNIILYTTVLPGTHCMVCYFQLIYYS